MQFKFKITVLSLIGTFTKAKLTRNPTTQMLEMSIELHIPKNNMLNVELTIDMDSFSYLDFKLCIIFLIPTKCLIDDQYGFCFLFGLQTLYSFSYSTDP